MKKQTNVLAVLALLSAAFVITGCPHHHRPHVPHPHRLPHPLQPVNSLLQIEGQDNAVVLSMLAAESPSTARINY